MEIRLIWKSCEVFWNLEGRLDGWRILTINSMDWLLVYWKLIRQRIDSLSKMVTSNRKVFFILLILQLAVANFSVAALHDACLCGEACRHGLGEKAETRDSGTHHDRCSDPGCESCNVEKMINLGAHILCNSYEGVRSYEAPYVIVVSAERLFDNHSLKHFDSIYSGGGTARPAIYMQNLSLLF